MTESDSQTATPDKIDKPGRAGPRTGRWWPRRKLVEFGYLVGRGLTGPDIGHQIGCSQVSVINACARYGLRLARRRNGDTAIAVVVSKRTRKALDDAAGVRGITCTELVERVLAVVGEEGAQFADGVLDDGVEFLPEEF